MAWIESHTSLEKHPKALLLKRRMRWSQNETIGFLHRFWWTVLDYAPTGLVSALPLEVLSEALDMDAAVLGRAMGEMEKVGLLQRVGDRVLVHDWIDYAGEYLRTTKFRRQPQKWQATQALYQAVRDASPAPAAVAGDMSREPSRDMSRVPDLPDQPDLTRPAGGDMVQPWMRVIAIGHMRDAGFVQAYGDWLAHLRQRQRDPSVLTIREQLGWLGTMPLARAVEVVRHSIRTGYLKLTEPDAGPRPSKRARDKEEFDEFIDGIAATLGDGKEKRP